MSQELVDKVYVPSPEEVEKERQWILNKIDEIGVGVLQNLAQSEAAARNKAYQPYSKYSVGASILTVSGTIYSSCNAETVSYTETDHAERSAITKAISEGEIDVSGRKFIKAIAVSHSGESGPCGGCRQRIAEHADNALIMDVGVRGKIKKITSLKILFPYSFNPSHLGM